MHTGLALVLRKYWHIPDIVHVYAVNVHENIKHRSHSRSFYLLSVGQWPHLGLNTQSFLPCYFARALIFTSLHSVHTAQDNNDNNNINLIITVFQRLICIIMRHKQNCYRINCTESTYRKNARKKSGAFIVCPLIDNLIIIQRCIKL